MYKEVKYLGYKLRHGVFFNRISTEVYKIGREIEVNPALQLRLTAATRSVQPIAYL